MALFLRIVGTADKAQHMLSVVGAANSSEASQDLFFVGRDSLAGFPGGQFVYAEPDAVRGAFRRLPSFESDSRVARRGVGTNDDFRFLRLSFEVSTPAWRPHAKGGQRGNYYGALPLRVLWGETGEVLKAFIESKGDSPSRYIRSEHLYGKAGITWSLRTTSDFGTRVLPSGVVFGSKGPVAITEGDPAAMLGVCNSRPFRHLVQVQMAASDTAARSYEVGVIQATPFPEVSPTANLQLSLRGHRAWSLKRSLDTITETSHAFLLPALLQVSGTTVADRAAAWAARVAATEAELAAIQCEIDDIAFRLYGIDGEDRARIEAESGGTKAAPSSDEAEPSEEPEAAEDDGDEEDDESAAADTATLATELLSWAVGVAFGRFDIDYAGGLREPPPEPGPFDPLPARSPGMSPDDSRAVEVLVDEEGHPEDLVQSIANVFGHAFGPWHDERLDEAAQLAGAPDLRTWLRRSFFPFHLKRYSKSRRKAPIWWPLSTASGSYTLWVSWPRLTRDTLFRLTSEQEPYVAAKVAQETRKLTSLKQDAGKAPTTAQAKAIGAQEDFVAELTALRDELAMIAPMWNPVHDDGVVLHAALLWRVTRDAGWQKECREKWEGLAAGKYDWAHIAMHLWPERVVPKCREDRSLAIAHGLEGRFWVEIAGKWRLRDATDQAMNEEIAARSSAAVKKALRAFVEAPGPARGRKGRKG